MLLNVYCLSFDTCLNGKYHVHNVIICQHLLKHCLKISWLHFHWWTQIKRVCDRDRQNETKDGQWMISMRIYIHVETVSIGLFIARVCLNKSYLIRRIWIFSFSFSFRFNWKTCQPKMIWFIRHVLAQHQIYWLSAFNDELKLEKCHRNWFIRSAYWASKIGAIVLNI